MRYSTTCYGYYVMVDHGGGFVTLYGHCSKILVHQDRSVSAGTKIAEVGTTGRSTGNHLHFEIRIGGKNKIQEVIYHKGELKMKENMNIKFDGKEVFHFCLCNDRGTSAG